ncbi:uncharacterized protein PG998_005366 [Apiospora kogelbergensis]|uniref:uncharacterized protein n=1 Tax=Apiospora kogelbergensis TaxID=1337665 RepID=UPI00312D18CD
MLGMEDGNRGDQAIVMALEPTSGNVSVGPGLSPGCLVPGPSRAKGHHVSRSESYLEGEFGAWSRG